MTSVVLIAERAGGKVAFVIRHYTTLSIDLDTPVETIIVPETEAENAHLIKVQGNFKSLSLNWILAEVKTTSGLMDMSDVGNSDGLVTENIGTNNIKSVDEQEKFLEEEFETVGLAEGVDELVIPFKNAAGQISSRRFAGKISKVLCSRDSSEPVTWVATVSMFIGKNLTSVVEESE